MGQGRFILSLSVQPCLGIVMPFASEALALGFTSGSACLASCGVILLPWLTSMRRGWRSMISLLGLFLAGRLAGYLTIGMMVGIAGRWINFKGPGGMLLGGLADLGAALLMGFQAWRGLKRQDCPVAKGGSLERRFGLAGLALLGLLTGLNICGPFVVAAVRAAQAGGLLPAVGFFALFFLGTAVWMLPLAAAGGFRRWPALAIVSRLMLALLSVFYAYTGLVLLMRWKHV
jgi:hypothetical protein